MQTLLSAVVSQPTVILLAIGVVTLILLVTSMSKINKIKRDLERTNEKLKELSKKMDDTEKRRQREKKATWFIATLKLIFTTLVPALVYPHDPNSSFLILAISLVSWLFKDSD